MSLLTKSAGEWYNSLTVGADGYHPEVFYKHNGRWISGGDPFKNNLRWIDHDVSVRNRWATTFYHEGLGRFVAISRDSFEIITSSNGLDWYVFGDDSVAINDIESDNIPSPVTLHDFITFPEDLRGAHIGKVSKAGKTTFLHFTDTMYILAVDFSASDIVSEWFSLGERVLGATVYVIGTDDFINSESEDVAAFVITHGTKPSADFYWFNNAQLEGPYWEGPYHEMGSGAWVYTPFAKGQLPEEGIYKANCKLVGHDALILLNSGTNRSLRVHLSVNGVGHVGQYQLPVAADWSDMEAKSNWLVAIARDSDVVLANNSGGDDHWIQAKGIRRDLWNRVEYSGDRWVAITEDSRLTQYSYDGQNWEALSMQRDGVWTDLAGNGTMFIAGSSDSVSTIATLDFSEFIKGGAPIWYLPRPIDEGYNYGDNRRVAATWMTADNKLTVVEVIGERCSMQSGIYIWCDQKLVYAHMVEADVGPRTFFYMSAEHIFVSFFKDQSNVVTIVLNHDNDIVDRHEYDADVGGEYWGFRTEHQLIDSCTLRFGHGEVIIAGSIGEPGVSYGPFQYHNDRGTEYLHWDPSNAFLGIESSDIYDISLEALRDLFTCGKSTEHGQVVAISGNRAILRIWNYDWKVVGISGGRVEVIWSDYKDTFGSPVAFSPAGLVAMEGGYGILYQVEGGELAYDAKMPTNIGYIDYVSYDDGGLNDPQVIYDIYSGEDVELEPYRIGKDRYDRSGLAGNYSTEYRIPTLLYQGEVDG